MSKAKLISIISSALLALVLAFGWSLTGWLKDNGKVSDQQRLWILVFLAVVFIINQVYLAMPKPVDNEEIEKRRHLIELYLKNVYAVYYEKLTVVIGNNQPSYPAVRIHLMLPTYRMLGLMDSYLKVYYYFCPGPIIYNAAESDLRWKKEEGTCGWAWARNRKTLYDSENPDYAAPPHRLTSSQWDVVKPIQSVISFPVWYNGKVVGVLGLDSKENVTTTKFNEQPVYREIEEYAKALAPYCPLDGVKAQF